LYPGGEDSGVSQNRTVILVTHFGDSVRDR
jgi:hypothetical protein